jgi:hypothetical protein
MKLADCLPLLLMVTTVRCIRSSGLNVSAERKESAWQIREFWKDLIGPRIQWVVKAAADVGDIQAQTGQRRNGTVLLEARLVNLAAQW